MHELILFFSYLFSSVFFLLATWNIWIYLFSPWDADQEKVEWHGLAAIASLLLLYLVCGPASEHYFTVYACSTCSE